MRLIDADALIEELKSLQVFVTGLREGKGVLNEYAKQYRESLLRIVDEQPTAYDVNFRNKAIDDFFEVLQEFEDDDMWLRLKISSIYEIAEQLKAR